MDVKAIKKTKLTTNNTDRLGNKSITKLLVEFSLPAVIAFLVNSIYNIVDRIFIGQYVGQLAYNGVYVAFPIMLIIMGIVERDLTRVFYLILFGNIKSLLIEHIPMSSDFV